MIVKNEVQEDTFQKIFNNSYQRIGGSELVGDAFSNCLNVGSIASSSPACATTKLS